MDDKEFQAKCDRFYNKHRRVGIHHLMKNKGIAGEDAEEIFNNAMLNIINTSLRREDIDLDRLFIFRGAFQKALSTCVPI